MNVALRSRLRRSVGYIADEMNMGLHELGPMAMRSRTSRRINSTCTVFAGAELRDRLSLGEKRETVGGLRHHLARDLRRLAVRSASPIDWPSPAASPGRSGGARAGKVIKEIYGDVVINVNPDSIYTGALGAAEFAPGASGQADGGRRR